MLKSTTGLLITLLCCGSALPQEAQPGSLGALQQIIPGHYVFVSGNLNSGVIAAGDSVVVLDALSSEAVAQAEREAIAKTIGQPVRVLVSSTFHNNYSKGNLAYADVWRIGHENYRTDLLASLQRAKASPEEQISQGATEDRAVANLSWPQYEKLRGYDTQRERRCGACTGN